MVVCFKCSYKNFAADIFFCKNCSAMLPVTTNNPFLLFSLTEAYSVDLEEVTQIYNELQAKIHPDNFPNLDKVTELLATQNIMHINQAYKILKSPRFRSEFLLQQQNIIINQDGKNTLDPSVELLNEIFALNEEASDIHEDQEREDFSSKLEKELAQINVSLEADFQSLDFLKAAHNSMRYRYIEKILQDLQ